MTRWIRWVRPGVSTRWSVRMRIEFYVFYMLHEILVFCVFLEFCEFFGFLKSSEHTELGHVSIFEILSPTLHLKYSIYFHKMPPLLLHLCSYTYRRLLHKWLLVLYVYDEHLAFVSISIYFSMINYIQWKRFKLIFSKTFYVRSCYSHRLNRNFYFLFIIYCTSWSKYWKQLIFIQTIGSFAYTLVSFWNICNKHNIDIMNK
jgi:hypothetical protein